MNRFIIQTAVLFTFYFKNSESNEFLSFYIDFKPGITESLYWHACFETLSLKQHSCFLKRLHYHKNKDEDGAAVFKCCKDDGQIKQVWSSKNANCSFTLTAGLRLILSLNKRRDPMISSFI